MKAYGGSNAMWRRWQPQLARRKKRGPMPRSRTTDVLAQQVRMRLLEAGALWPVLWHVDAVQVVTPVTWPNSLQPVVVSLGLQTKTRCKYGDEFRELHDGGGTWAYAQAYTRRSEKLHRLAGQFGLLCRKGRPIMRRLTERQAGAAGNILDFAEAVSALVATLARALVPNRPQALLDTAPDPLAGW